MLGDVIYNALYPLAQPDVIFGPEDEHFRPYPSVGAAKNALTDWNSKDPSRLLALILELRFEILFYFILFWFLFNVYKLGIYWLGLSFAGLLIE